jgi:hypothetical protein
MKIYTSQELYQILFGLDGYFQNEMVTRQDIADCLTQHSFSFTQDTLDEIWEMVEKLR